MMIQVGKVLYILTDGFYLDIKHDTVEIIKNKSVVSRIPLLDLSQIMIIANAVIFAYLISACSQYHILISYVSPYGKYLGSFYGKEIGNVTLRMKQYCAFESDQKLKIARNIVLGKIINERQLLSQYESKSEQIREVRKRLGDGIDRLLECSSVDEIRGVEGECASLYFSAFDEILSGCPDSMKFMERSKHPPKNRFNAVLSLLYTLETTTCTAAIYSFGLDPFLGFLHEIHPGRESLACDLVEEFRSPVIDAFVLKSVNRREINDDDFEEEENTFYLTQAGRKKVLGSWEKYKENKVYFGLYKKEVPIKILPFLQAQLMAQHIRGDIPEYPPFTEWRW